jgi:protease-4
MKRYLMWSVGLAAVVLFSSLGIVGCGPTTFVVGVGPGDRQMVATPVQRDGRWGSRRVMILDVSGTIVNAEGAGVLIPGDNPVARFNEALRLAAADDKVAAVILRLNTPGGTVTASDILYRQVQRFRQATKKPVVAMMMDVATSGGYYVACAADEIVAYPSTITGSIGVIFQTFSVKPALDRIGVTTEALVSGPNKAAGSPLQNLESEQREILQGLVDGFYDDFVAVVKRHRTEVAEDRWATVLDGRVFSGREAQALGLVDEVGDLPDAFARAKALAGLKRADLFVVHRPLDYVASPYAAAGGRTGDAISGGGRASGGGGGTQVNLMQINLDGLTRSASGACYLWVPEVGVE